MNLRRAGCIGRPMTHGHARWYGVAILLAIFLAIGLPAGLGVASASVSTPTPPDRTALAARHRAGRHRHRHTPRTPATTNVLATSGGTGAAPAKPARPGPRPHKARPPFTAQRLRHGSGWKSGARSALTARAGGAPTSTAVRSVQPRQNLTSGSRAGAVISGRGPPRGSPSRTTRGRAPPAPAVEPDAHPRASSPPASLRTPASIAFVSSPRRVFHRLHADRSGGATACLSMPSYGGIPCPASCPSSPGCSRSVS